MVLERTALGIEFGSTRIKAVLLAWGSDPLNAVHNAVVLEEVAFMNWHAQAINPNISSMSKDLLDKHYLRKHGKNTYYGQKK